MRLLALFMVVFVGTVLLLVLQEVHPVPPSGAEVSDAPRSTGSPQSRRDPILARVPIQSGHRFLDEGRQNLEIRYETTILDALSRIDLNDTVDLRAVTLVRKEPEPLAVVVDLRSMILTGNTWNNLVLRTGDVLWLR